MRLLQFRLQSLMVAVAVSGVLCWVVVSFPPSILLLIPTIGPASGACFTWYTGRQDFDSIVLGAFKGYHIQSIIVATVVAGSTLYFGITKTRSESLVVSACLGFASYMTSLISSMLFVGVVTTLHACFHLNVRSERRDPNPTSPTPRESSSSG